MPGIFGADHPAVDADGESRPVDEAAVAGRLICNAAQVHRSPRFRPPIRQLRSRVRM